MLHRRHSSGDRCPQFGAIERGGQPGTPSNTRVARFQGPSYLQQKVGGGHCDKEMGVRSPIF